MTCTRLGRLYKGLKSIYINSKGSLAQWWRICLPVEEMQVIRVPSLGWEIPWRRKWQPAPALLPGKSLGQRSLASYSPWGWEKLDTTERLSMQSREAASEYFSRGNILGFHCYTSCNSFLVQINLEILLYLLRPEGVNLFNSWNTECMLAVEREKEPKTHKELDFFVFLWSSLA